MIQPPSIALLRALRSSAFNKTACRPLHTSRINPTGHHCVAKHNHEIRRFSNSSPNLDPQTNLPATTDRGPKSSEDTVTDFSAMDVLSSTPAPTTAIDACLSNGFHFDNGLKISGGSGCLLVGGEAFSWRPWEAGARKSLLNAKGQWDIAREAWGLLDIVWPKPDLLILGLGPSMHPISPETRRFVNSLGIRIDVQDTRNAAAQFNLLATERGVGNVAAAMIPIGRRDS